MTTFERRDLAPTASSASALAARRLTGAAGIAGVVLLFVGFGALGDTPDPHDPASQLAAYFVDHRSAVFTSAALAALGSIGVVVFLIGLRERLRVAGAPVAATIALVAGGAVVAFVELNELIYATLAYQVAADSPTTAKALFALTIVASTLQGPWAAALLAVASLVAWRQRALPRALAVVGFVGAIAVVPAAVSFGETGFFYPDVQQQIVSQIFLLWLLAAAIVVVCRPAPRSGGGAL